MNDRPFQQLADRFLPMPWWKYFTDQRCPDGMWFGDELPPTLQDYLNDPKIQQAQQIAKLQALMDVYQSEQRAKEIQDAHQRFVKRMRRAASR